LVKETVLFDPANRWVPERATIDALCPRCGDSPYLDGVFTDYFADYCGIMRQEKPKRFFEIGARYAYTAIVMLQALFDLDVDLPTEYLGIDDESYHHRSCDKANENLGLVNPSGQYQAVVRKWNSITQAMPSDCGMFDLIHIDGNKEYHGRLNDLMIAWPHLNAGGFIILDDAAKLCHDGTPGPTYVATMDFLKQFAESEAITVEWQYHINLTHHLYLRKCA
jgi:predicted O-methyltransferase YrrM